MNLRAFDAIHRLLEQTLKANPTIKRIILTDRMGITIAHASKVLEYLVEIDELGAIASHVFCAKQKGETHPDPTGLTLITFELDEGKIWLAACGEGILCFYTDQDNCTIKMLLRDLEPKLKELIAQYLKDPIIRTTTTPNTQ
ncbi:MAG: hypothetical protein ACTSRS_05380 [Candidatus Helarchaeota archaeon]